MSRAASGRRVTNPQPALQRLLLSQHQGSSSQRGREASMAESSHGRGPAAAPTPPRACRAAASAALHLPHDICPCNYMYSRLGVSAWTERCCSPCCTARNM